MAIQYPTYRADPNTRLDFSGLSKLLPNAYQGMKAGLTPYQLLQAQRKQAAEEGLAQAKTGAYQAQMYQALQPKSTSSQWELKQGGDNNWYSVNKMTGEIKPVMQDGSPFEGRQSGMAITLPDGTTISQGGGGSRGVKYYTDKDGNVIASPTTAEQTNIQKRLAATQDLTENIKKVLAHTHTYPYYGARGNLDATDKALIKYGVGNMFGSEDRRAEAAKYGVEKFENLERMVTSSGIQATIPAIQQAADALQIEPYMSEKEVIAKYRAALEHLKRQSEADTPRMLGFRTQLGTQPEQGEQSNQTDPLGIL